MGVHSKVMMHLPLVKPHPPTMVGAQGCVECMDGVQECVARVLQGLKYGWECIAR